jgi:TRAP-type C4-dicarboxylate transport system substrate-binding protein
MRRTAFATMVGATLFLIAAACGGSGSDKAGGKPEEKPLVLTLESEDDVALSGAPEFADAVERLSHGSMRIRFLQAGRSSEVEFERGVVQDVRGGRAQLGIVGTRVWDTTGVTSFRALLAPFLVDSLDLQRQVLESSLAESMLEGVGEAGVVGIALLPGPLRHPLGLSRAFVSLEDYRGATIGIRPGGVARAALRALKVRAKAYVPGDLSGLDGVETDLKTITYNGWDMRTGTLTTNVVLWPKPFSIVMNRKAFGSLSADQREILHRAGREARAPELRQIASDAEAALAEACRGGQLIFATASTAVRERLRAAVQPVYDEIEHDPQTRKWIAAIEQMRRGEPTAAAPLRCRKEIERSSAGNAALEGRWQVTWTRQDLAGAGLSVQGLPRTWSATVVYDFANGRFKGNSGELGTYEIDGDVLRLVFIKGRFVRLGRSYALKWSVFRDLLTLSLTPGSEPLQAHAIKPWRRVR